MGLTVYELGVVSWLFSASAAAAACTVADAFDRVTGLLGPPGLRGRGGGALFGSALSHLQFAMRS